MADRLWYRYSKVPGVGIRIEMWQGSPTGLGTVRFTWRDAEPAHVELSSYARHAGPAVSMLGRLFAHLAALHVPSPSPTQLVALVVERMQAERAE